MHSTMASVWYHLSVTIGLALTEDPVSFEVGLPPECKIVGKPSRSYNQGQCSRQKCHTLAGLCSYSSHCCYEATNTSIIQLQCANSSQLLERHVIHECGCRLCSNQYVTVEGRVVASPDQEPVVLAAFMLDSEVLGMSDEDGHFSFVVSSMQDTCKVTVVEPQHKPTTIELHMDTLSSSYELLITLERISGEVVVSDVMAGFQLQLENSKTVTDKAGIFSSRASLTVPPKVLITSSGMLYTGSGKVLHSIYKPSEPPSFDSPALQDMTYKLDNQLYAIKALVLGSVSIVDDTGRLLSVKQGSEVKIEVHFQFDTTATLEEVNKIHLFSYSEVESSWTDHGEVLVEDKGLLVGGRRLYSIEGKMKGIGSFWAMGLPQPLSCYVKVKVLHENTSNELEGIRVTLEQSNEELGHKTFYRYADKTRQSQGICLKSSCSEGGTILATKDNGEWAYPKSPSIRHGIIMDNRPELLTYYITDTSVDSHGNTPYYRSEQECLQGNLDTSYFEFNMETQSFPSQPVVMTVPQPNSAPYCFVKVAVDDCLLYTDIFSLSFDKNTKQLVASYGVVATEPDRKIRSDECYSDDVTKHRAACVQYACGHSVHISVQNRPQFAARKDCKYLSHSTHAPQNDFPSTETTSASVYSFLDSGHQYSSYHLNTGLYHGNNKDLTLLKCLAGDEQRPSQRLSHTDGVAVTFTCQV